MLPILIVAAIITLFIRRYYYDRASGQSTALSILVYSTKYYLSQQIERDDSFDTKKLKKTGNVALFIFYFLFLDAILYAVFVPTGI